MTSGTEDAHRGPGRPMAPPIAASAGAAGAARACPGARAGVSLPPRPGRADVGAWSG